MPTNYAYIFLEVAIITYAAVFGWEHWSLKRLLTPTTLYSVIGLAFLWFALDEIAVSMGFWTFPEEGTLPIRILSLPVEEYVIFFLHPFVCIILISRYRGRAC